MRRWSEIIEMPCSPSKRLQMIFRLLKAINYEYDFDSRLIGVLDNWDLKINENAMRSISFSFTTSIIKITNEKNNLNKVMTMLEGDYKDKLLAKEIVRRFNTELNKDEKQAILLKFYFDYLRDKCLDKMNLSKKGYYKILNSAKNKLIISFGLDFFDKEGFILDYDTVLNNRGFDRYKKGNK